MSTILEKVNEIRDEKDNKLVPKNIKAGVTILGVTGTYTGPELVSLNYGQQLTFYPTVLYNFLVNTLTTAQKAEELNTASGAPSPIITFGSCNYTPSGGTTQTASLVIGMTNRNTLNISIIDSSGNEHIIETLADENDSGDWSQPFTVAKFLNVWSIKPSYYNTINSTLSQADTANADLDFSFITLHTINNDYTLYTSDLRFLEEAN